MLATGMHIVVMGVSGAGKTTVGRQLARRLGRSFVDADDYHPAANKAKMAKGIPLTDGDRRPWLQKLNAVLGQSPKPVVLACSALTRDHRRRLAEGLVVRFAWLTGNAVVIRGRLDQRHGHFADVGLLDSQLATLEAPRRALQVDVSLSVNCQVAVIAASLGNPEQ